MDAVDSFQGDVAEVEQSRENFQIEPQGQPVGYKFATVLSMTYKRILILLGAIAGCFRLLCFRALHIP